MLPSLLALIPISSPSRTPQELEAAPAVPLRLADLEQFAPSAKAQPYRRALAEHGDLILAEYGINEHPLRLAHFMAQIGYESFRLTATHENLNYTPERMVEVFGGEPAHLKLEEARMLLGNREAFAERVYGLGNPIKAAELGNTKSGDGYRYLGRGLIQLTGRAGYREYGNKIGIDLESNPEAAADPVTAIRIAACFWHARNLNAYADENLFVEITRGINGGDNGLEHRRQYFEEAWRIWGHGTRLEPRNKL